jgi:thioredoxin reductase
MPIPASENAPMYAEVSADYDIVIVGSGPAGLSAASRAHSHGTRHILLEAEQHTSDTIFKYQKGKHVMCEPSILPLRSGMRFDAGKREHILNNWQEDVATQGINIAYNKRITKIQRDAHGQFTLQCQDGSEYTSRTVILAIGLQGNIRRLGVPGENLPLVQYTLSDPDEFKNETIIVVGAGDAGIENALALAAHNTVYIINRGDEFANCKDGNRDLLLAAEKSGKIQICYTARALRVEETEDTPSLRFIFNGKDGEGEIVCHRVIARLGATPPRSLLDGFGITFPNTNPNSVPVLSDKYESNVPGLFIVGALGGYPLIKQAMNQGYEVVDNILGLPTEPVDVPLLLEKFKQWQPGASVPAVLDLIINRIPLFNEVSKLQLRELLLESDIHCPTIGSTLFKKSDYTNSFFSILDGTVDIDIHDDGNANITLPSGLFFGEMGLISGRRRTATALAGTGCVVLETPRRSILKLIS